MAPKIGSKDPCPCGSKKKYKNCCGREGTHSTSKKQTQLVLSAIGVGVVAVILIAVLTKSQNTSNPPPGAAPAGKVWSPEHGHWHDAPVSVQNNPTPQPLNPFPTQPTQSNPPNSATNLTPQPPGPAPAGKVWSPEHGHWHDATASFQNNPTPQPFNPLTTQPIQVNPPGPATNLTPQPPGPAPAGKVWSPEHGHWHDAPQ